MRGIVVVATLVFTGLAATATAAARLYHDVPPPRHTGGFGEGDCAACHFDNPPDDGQGAVTVSGLPERWEPGRRYRIAVEVRRADMKRAGFQAAIRYADGERAGEQAGTLRALDGRTAVVEAGGVGYAHQTAAGAGVENGVARWRVEWTAPARPGGAVVVHAAGNAANGDDSAFGDHVYTTEARSSGRR